LIKGDGAVVWPVDIRGQGRRAVSRPQRTHDKNAPVELGFAPAGGADADLRGGAVEVRDDGLGLVIGLGDAGAVEGVGGDEVGAGRDETSMDLLDQRGLRQAENVVVAPQVVRMPAETCAAEITFRELAGLDHRAFGSFENGDAPLE
jgi:hypothetical protein